MSKRFESLSDLVVAAETELADLRRVQAKAEADVAQVADRAARDRKLLDSGQVGSAKELANLTHEVESLARRQNDLEELELAAMERVEEAEAHARGLVDEQASLAAERDRLTQAQRLALDELALARDAATARRSAVRAELPSELLALYDKLREQHGVGAARLHRGRCEGCQLELTKADIDRIRSTPDDVILRCEECRRILVRTPESGL